MRVSASDLAQPRASDQLACCQAVWPEHGSKHAVSLSCTSSRGDLWTAGTEGHVVRCAEVHLQAGHPAACAHEAASAGGTDMSALQRSFSLSLSSAATPTLFWSCCHVPQVLLPCSQVPSHVSCKPRDIADLWSVHVQAPHSRQSSFSASTAAGSRAPGMRSPQLALARCCHAVCRHEHGAASVKCQTLHCHASMP